MICSANFYSWNVALGIIRREYQNSEKDPAGLQRSISFRDSLCKNTFVSLPGFCLFCNIQLIQLQ